MAASSDGRAWWRVATVLFVVGWGGNQVTPMLVVYRDELGIAPAALAATFGVYAFGLVAGLLLGGRASDVVGRRIPVLALATLSPMATVVLMAAAGAPAALWPARLLAGLASGVVFAAGSAWIQDLLADSAPTSAPRRTAMALSAGFALGPLVAATLAAFVPAPLVLPYVPHLVLSLLALAVVVGVPDVGRVRARTPWLLEARSIVRAAVSVPPAVRSRAFLAGVVPLAPWVFACASIAFAVLPAVAGDVPVAEAGVLTALTLGTGVGVQPIARRMPADAAARFGLLSAAVGGACGAIALWVDGHAMLFVAAVPLGAAYGLCLVAGLRRVESLAPAAERGATLAWFYALTYTGFAAPSLLGALTSIVTPTTALIGVSVVAGLCLAFTSPSLVRG